MYAVLIVVFMGLLGPVQARVVLSEVMYNPLGLDHHDEYVELVNTSEVETVILDGWRLGDEEELDSLVDKGAGLALRPGQFALVLDRSYFDHSTAYEEDLHEAVVLLTIQDRAFGRTGWPNSREGAVILCNAGGDTVEVLRYQPVTRPGFSWEKIDLKEAAKSDNWGKALVEGGTPGRLNSVYEQRRFGGERIELRAEPNPFSHRLVLSYRLPAAPALVNLWIYDIEGHLIRELMKDSSVGPSGKIEWDGQDREGRFVSAGMYIVYVSASAAGRVSQMKKVVVRRAP